MRDWQNDFDKTEAILQGPRILQTPPVKALRYWLNAYRNLDALATSQLARLEQKKQELERELRLNQGEEEELKAMVVAKHEKAEAAEAQCAAMREALKNIVSPLRYLQDKATQAGGELNEYAPCMANNPSFLKDLAEQSLSSTAGKDLLERLAKAEAAERSKGCDLCTPKNTMANMGVYGRRFAFCPMCGKRLKEGITNERLACNDV